MSITSRTAWLGGGVARAAVVACTVVMTSALSSLVAAPAHADPGICIDHVMEHGFEATDAVLKACKIAKTGESADRRECRRILDDEGVTRSVARRACRMASEPERTPA